MNGLLDRVMVIDREYHLNEIYDLVELHGNLDKQNLSRSGIGTNIGPRWNQTVRTA